MKFTPRPKGTVPYVPRDDRKLPPEEQSTFYIRPLNQGERMAAYDEMNVSQVSLTGGMTQTSRAWQQSLELCVERIERIENCPPGAPQGWPADKEARREYLEQLDDLVVNEIGTAIREASKASDAAGN
jgi:hypothetical protein